MSNLAEQFMELFDGLDRAYGTYQITSTRADGKQVGQAVTLKKPVTRELWEAHLAGGQGLGIIPIKDNSCCRFGAIDIDVYSNLDLPKLTKQVKKLGFPLVPCRSKSGGCHLFLFTTEEVAADLLQNKLKEMAAILGFGKCEIYPRQTKILVERQDLGQWINVPYFNGVKGLRYGIDEQGAPISPEDFIQIAKASRISDKQLRELKLDIRPDLQDGPPCLQYLISQGFPEGTRNDGLFNLGVYLLKAYPDDWKLRLEEYNRKFMQPPLGSTEVQGVFKSLDKKDYFYTCEKAPVVAFCNKSLCMTRKFGIGAMTMPNLNSLTKFNCDPPIWFLDVDGCGRLELTTDDLQNQVRFQKRCIESLNIMPPTIRKDQWQQTIQKLLEQVIVIAAPVDASPVGQLLEHLEKFCTTRVQAQTKDELLLGKPYSEDNKHFFRISDFMAYLERLHFREFKVAKVTSIIKDSCKADHHFIMLKGKGVNCWSIPEFKRQTELHAIPEIKNTQPY